MSCIWLQAGCYGRAFCPAASYPRKRILQVCKSLRILNALRGPNVGVPLTLAQLEALTPAVLVSRLINARRHLLALRVAEMMNMDTVKVSLKFGFPAFLFVSSLCQQSLKCLTLHGEVCQQHPQIFSCICLSYHSQESTLVCRVVLWPWAAGHNAPGKRAPCPTACTNQLKGSLTAVLQQHRKLWLHHSHTDVLDCCH